MNISLFTIGKLKDDFFQSAEKHYSKLLKSFCSLDIIEVKDEKILKNSDVEEVREKEGERLLRFFEPRKEIIVLDQGGKMFTSESFSSWLQEKNDKGIALQFVIGGPYGISKKVKEKAEISMSISSFTLPHQLARIVFLEQLYRGFTIMKGKKYHY